MSSAEEDQLTVNQTLALIRETTASRNLLAYGLLALRRTAFIDETRDPILTMLSIGVEKAMKMGLGLLNVAVEGKWLSRNVLRNTYRHDLVLMDSTLRTQLCENLDRSTYAGVFAPLLEAVEADPLWQPIVAMLDRYGREGRFYNLDALAEVTQPDDDPEEYWSRVDQIAVNSDTAVKRAWDLCIADSSKMDEFNAILNERIAQSIEAWWRMNCMAGVQGVLAERGKGWGFDFHPSMVGRQA